MHERYPEIRFPRGDTHTIAFQFPIDGEPYILSTGDVVRFGVFRGRKAMVMKLLTADDQSEDGTLTAQFLPGDTSWMRPGKYEYERELITAGGEVYTLLRAPFVLDDDLITPDSRDGTETQPDSSETGGLAARCIAYDNSVSGMEAESVQEAIDELSSNPKVSTPDWNQNDETQPDYIKGRTHWVEVTEGVISEIFPETSLTSTEVYQKLGLIAGETYTVTWNGTEYECIAVEYTEDGITAVVLGDMYTMSGGNFGTVATGEPFVIVEYPPELAAAEGFEGLFMVAPLEENVESMVLSIIGATGGTRTVHKLPDKFIDAEWLAKKSVVTRTVVETMSWPSGNLTATFDLTADMFENVKEIRVILTIDGETVVDTLPPSFTESGVFMTAMGQYFRIDNYIFDPVGALSFYAYADLSGTPSTVMIEADFYEYDQLPREYLTTVDMGSLAEDEGGGTTTMTQSLTDAAVMLRNGITVRYNKGFVLAAYGDLDTARHKLVWVDKDGIHVDSYVENEDTSLFGWVSTTYATPAELTEALAGYYTKTEIDNLLSGADNSDSEADDNQTSTSVMTGATADTAGTAGLVPAPSAGQQDMFLRGDGTWATPVDTDTDTDTDTKTTKATEYASGAAVADNHLYEITVASTVTIEAGESGVCPVFGSHFIVTIADGGSVTLNCLSSVGDDISTAAAGEVWEVSVLCGRCVVMKMS